MDKSHQLTRIILSLVFLSAGTAFSFDDFNAQMIKTAHEETSWRHDLYTTADSAGLWKSDSEWFQKPSIAFRLNGTQEKRSPRILSTPSGAASSTSSDSELWSPMVSAGFQSWGGLDLGIAYARSFQDLELRVPTPAGGIATVIGDIEYDHLGGYVAKQWACGLKASATWSYTRTHGERYVIPEFDTSGASVGVGFARSFGEKKIGRNLFVDTSANFLYQSEGDPWHFLWLAKAGHNFHPRLSAYGIFNLFHRLEDASGFSAPIGPSGFHPIGDETWGEAGGGLQAQLGFGVLLTGEVTVPVLDEGITAEDAFQARVALSWRF